MELASRSTRYVGVEHVCAAIVFVGHAYRGPLLTVPPVTPRYQATRCGVPLLGLRLNTPRALSVGYGSVVLPLSPPMRISKWRCGAVALPVMPVRPITSPWATVRALADELREVGVEVGVAVGAAQVDGVAAGTLVGT